VIARRYAIETPLPAAKLELKRLTEILAPDHRAGDFAQAMMDLGATLCTPKNPACALCPWNDVCAARLRGDPETFPRKAARKSGALRKGAAFVALRADGFILVRTRAEKGLLGGMTEVPSAWSRDFDASTALMHAPFPAAAWRRLPGRVTHVFTHFPLELVVYCAELPKSARVSDGARWVALDDLAQAALPSVMRKVIFHAIRQ
jgi:A/G-specific adenine glycosylase